MRSIDIKDASLTVDQKQPTLVKSTMKSTSSAKYCLDSVMAVFFGMVTSRTSWRRNWTCGSCRSTPVCFGTRRPTCSCTSTTSWSWPTRPIPRRSPSLHWSQNMTPRLQPNHGATPGRVDVFEEAASTDRSWQDADSASPSSSLTSPASLASTLRRHRATPISMKVMTVNVLMQQTCTAGCVHLRFCTAECYHLLSPRCCM